MAARGREAGLSDLARIGFSELDRAVTALDELAELAQIPRGELLDGAERAADADGALDGLLRIARRDLPAFSEMLGVRRRRHILWALLGASEGFANFYVRRPESLRRLGEADTRLPSAAEIVDAVLTSVDVTDGVAGSADEEAWVALRVAYREQLAAIASHDLLSDDPLDAIEPVSRALADAAAAVVEGSLAVARARLRRGASRIGAFTSEELAGTRLAVIAMGKAGARELNYVSDVDVIFVAERTEGAELTEARMLEVAHRLAIQTMHGITEAESEPPLWEVDANLRPEGAKGALVRTLASHLAYYERWAESWEFQALLKARAFAGDVALGEAYVDATRPLVWESARRDGFVDSVQRMRERVTSLIPSADLPHQIKLGPGGIRDVEFAVQLIQLVHGSADESIRRRSTLDALDALVVGGYIGRHDGIAFARDYRLLRLIEHRLQLRALTRTHLMPRDDDGMRVLARATRVWTTASAVRAGWDEITREVRDIHLRLFYRPLLSAVAAIADDQRRLTEDEAQARLRVIGFQDAQSALRHIRALTSGLSRKATIQRHLLPVLLRWFAEGADADRGLVAYRRISERLGETPWFLRMLRDSSGAAQNLTRVLSCSRYIGDLMEWIPESVAWLESAERLRPRTRSELVAEARAIQDRHHDLEGAMSAVRALRRREMLRAAMGAVLDVLDIDALGAALTDITEATIQATLRAVRRHVVPAEDESLEFAVIAMGRLGGRELGFGSDADVLFVYRANEVPAGRAQERAAKIVAELRRVSEDFRLPLDLDADLRPEGRNGPLVRSLDAYGEYYRRWSVAWEAQALLRARGIAGSPALIASFFELVDRYRYPEQVEPRAEREIKRIKARVESERVARGVDPRRHLKLGPGALSDVEWLVQLWQLQRAAGVAALRTTSTLDALDAAREIGIIDDEDAGHLADAWRLAGRLRSANTLSSGKTSDVLPHDQRSLDGIGRILAYPAGSAARVEEDWLRASRRARKIFDRLFYGDQL